MIAYNDIDKIVSTTHDTVNKLLTYRNWPDALALYFRYIQQRKMQWNSTTLSSTRFMRKATWRGQDRLMNAKKVLIDAWMIEEVKRRNEDWELKWRYIKVNFIITSVPESDTVVVADSISSVLETPTTGKQVQNTLVENNINTLEENIYVENPESNTNATFNKSADVDKKPAFKNQWERFEEFWKIFPHARPWKKKDSLDFYRRNDYTESEIIYEANLLVLKVKYWLQDSKYIPWCHYRIRDFIKTHEVTLQQTIKQIMYMHMKNPKKVREDAQLLFDTFWKELFDKYVKEVKWFVSYR